MGVIPVGNIFGDDNPNTLSGTAAADSVYGRGGNDTLIAVDGYDELYGEAGDDILFSGGSNNDLYGGDGNDTVDYSRADLLEGGARARIGMQVAGSGASFADTIGADVENLTGTPFSDWLMGSAADNILKGETGIDPFGSGDELYGEDGSDRLYGYYGDDKLYGGAGADLLYAGDEDDRLYGDAGADGLSGEEGDDVLRGGDGDDGLEGGAGTDILLGGAGFDTAHYSTSLAGVAVTIGAYGSGGDAEGDLVGPDVENIGGSNHADVLVGSAADNRLDGEPTRTRTGGNDRLSGFGGNDTLSGGLGDDILNGGTGADRLSGGAGIDTASYYAGTAGVAVNLVTGAGSGGEAQGDRLAEIENLSGSQGNDSLVGDTWANTLLGWNGNDVLAGAGGRDILTGGAGADRFVYGSAAQSVVGANADRITDFSHAQGDRIDLSAIDANTAAAGNQAFGFIGTAAYGGVAGQLRYVARDGVTTIGGDIDGDRITDFHITLTGISALVAADFVL
ncbi:calcium-binding protein [Inquilinus sp. Marseille-Q2685]|uniref:calcium-binding protein n=1 Tax=Inquilinus sp. Marseille-Q2685 TaxID=2866581 RepID=UPI001CE4383D|nr:calcium-binding protein [Inquilinus sp. Marseille-Q2685]